MWRPIETLPMTGQALVTDDELAGDDLSPTEGYGTIELVVCPMLADGRILNQNSGNYSRRGAWKWWAPVPARRTMPLSEDDRSAITENLRSQGVPIGTKQ